MFIYIYIYFSIIELNLDENYKNTLEYDDDEENYENESIAESELSANDDQPSINDSSGECDDDDDDEINFKQKVSTLVIMNKLQH